MCRAIERQIQLCAAQLRVNNCWWCRIVFLPGEERTQKAIRCTAIEPINDAEPQSLAASFKLSASLFAYISPNVEPLAAAARSRGKNQNSSLSLNPHLNRGKRAPPARRLEQQTDASVNLTSLWISCDRRKLDVNKLNHCVVYHNFSCHAIREIRVRTERGKNWHPPCAKQLVFYLWNIFVLALPSMEYNNTILGFICGVAGTDWHQNAPVCLSCDLAPGCLCLCGRLAQNTHTYIYSASTHSLARYFQSPTSLIFGHVERNPATESVFRCALSLMRAK